MSISIKNKSTKATDLWFDENKMHISLEDGREMSIPIDWFPSLRDASKEQRDNYIQPGAPFYNPITNG